MFKRLHLVLTILLFGIVSCNNINGSSINGSSIQPPKIDSIINEAQHLSNAGELKSRDSLINESSIKLKANSDWNELFSLYKWYLNEYELPNKIFACKLALEYYTQACYSGNNDEEFNSSYLASKLFFEKNEYDRDTAVTMGDEAVKYANLSENPRIKARGFIIKANNAIKANNESDAFDYLLKAMYEAEILCDTSLQIEALDTYAKLYEKLEDYERSKQYRYAQLDLIAKCNQSDSLPFMGEKIKLANLLNANKEFSASDGLLYDLISYSVRNKKSLLKNNALQVLRSNFLGRGDLKGFVALYTNSFPDQLNDLKHSQNAAYYRFMAYKSEIENNIDSSKIYHEKEKSNTLATSSDSTTRGTMLRRIAQFYCRHNMIDNAIINYKSASEYLKSMNYLPFEIECYQMLDSLFLKKKKYEQAYYYRAHFDKLLEIKSISDKKNHGFKIELRYNEEMVKFRETKSHKEQETKLSEISSGIGFVVSFLFIIFISFISIDVPEKYVKIIGFLSFVFLFEFIIIWSDKKIIELTGDNIPVNIMIRMLIGIVLYLLHHIIESRVIKYVLTHKINIVKK